MCIPFHQQGEGVCKIAKLLLFLFCMFHHRRAHRCQVSMCPDRESTPAGQYRPPPRRNSWTRSSRWRWWWRIPCKYTTSNSYNHALFTCSIYCQAKTEMSTLITLCTQDTMSAEVGILWWWTCTWGHPQFCSGPCWGGPSYIPGYDKVVTLIGWFFGQFEGFLRCTSEYDRKPITFPAHHQLQLVDGRVKVSRKSTVVPGLDSTRRCFVGQNSGPATWPNCNRYVEVVHIKLCQIYPSPVKKYNHYLAVDAGWKCI